MPKGWGRIAIGTRLEKMVDSQFVKVWSRLISNGLRKGDGYIMKSDMPAHKAANELVRTFLKMNCDTLFMLDSDADVGQNFLNEFRDLEAGWGYDALQAFYTRRGWPPEAIWFKRASAGQLMQCFVFDDNFTTDVAIIGAHSVLIRREVFEKLLGGEDPDRFEWFFYPRHNTTSEDAAFSEEAVAAGFRLGATTAVKAGHITRVTTGWETYHEFLEISGQRDRVIHYRKLLELVSDFTGETLDDVESKVMRGSANVSEMWGKRAPATAPSVREFYGADDNGYLYDLVAWNSSPYYDQITEPLKHASGKRVLVVGAGLGTEPAMLAGNNSVDVFDLPGVLRRFCEWRSSRLNGQGWQMLSGDTLGQALGGADGRYNLIVMLDVVEHIHPDDFDATMDAAYRALAPTGAFYLHNNFKQQDIYPMHFDHSKLFASWMERNGLVSRPNPTGTELIVRRGGV